MERIAMCNEDKLAFIRGYVRGVKDAGAGPDTVNPWDLIDAINNIFEEFE